MVSFLKKLSSKSSQGSQVFPYFFDDDPTDSTCSKFWYKAQVIVEGQKTNPLIGFNFYKKPKKKTGDLKPLYVCLYKHYLIVSKSKEKFQKQQKSLDLSKHFLILQRMPSAPPKVVAGISLAYNQKQIELYSKSNEELTNFVALLKKFTVQTNFEEIYTLEKKLGSGSYANVYRIKDKVTRQDYAAKFFDIASFKDAKRSKMALKNEINIHRQLEHKNICKLYEIFDSPTHLIIVMEYGKGQRLLDYVIANSPLPEKEALSIVKELLEAVSYMHSLGFIHRDIKLENAMLDKDTNDSERLGVKLIDFGLSVTTDNIELFKKSGTPGYVAPEILIAETYGTQVDVFSLGVVLYTMLSGRSPFVGSDRETVLRLNRKCEFVFKPRHWDRINLSTKDLVKRMMEADPEKRITIQNALSHRCFSLVALHAQSLRALPREITITLTPQDNPKVEKLEKPDKTKTLNVENNSTTASRSIQNASKASLFKEKRSESAKPIESLMTTSRVSNNPNLLQIPQTKIILAPSEGEEEKGIGDIPSDGINKGSLRTFYRLNSDCYTEDHNNSWQKSQERLSPLFPVKNSLGIPAESPRLKDKVDSLRETDRMKSLSVSASVANSRSFVSSLNESQMSKKQSCELSFDSEDDATMIVMPKPRTKSSMVQVKKASRVKGRRSTASRRNKESAI